MAAKAAVMVIKHVYEKSKDDQASRIMRDNATTFVPTLSTLELFNLRNVAFETILKQTKDAYEEGVKYVCGGDTGPFAHGDMSMKWSSWLMPVCPSPMSFKLLPYVAGGYVRWCLVVERFGF